MRNLSAQRPDSPLTYRTGTLNLPAHPDESWRSHQPASRVRWSPRKRNVAEEIGNVRESASPRTQEGSVVVKTLSPTSFRPAGPNSVSRRAGDRIPGSVLAGRLGAVAVIRAPQKPLGQNGANE